MTCIAGGPIPPYPPAFGRDPRPSVSSSSLSSSVIGISGGNLASLALIAERYKSDMIVTARASEGWEICVILSFVDSAMLRKVCYLVS